MLSDITVDELQDLETLGDARINELIDRIFAANHLSINYLFGHVPDSDSANNNPTSAFSRHEFQSTIAGQVLPSFELGDTSPENLRGVNDSRYYFDYEVGNVPVTDEASVADTSSRASGGYVFNSTENIKRIHPSRALENPNFGQYAGMQKESTDF